MDINAVKTPAVGGKLQREREMAIKDDTRQGMKPAFDRLGRTLGKEYASTYAMGFRKLMNAIPKGDRKNAADRFWRGAKDHPDRYNEIDTEQGVERIIVKNTYPEISGEAMDMLNKKFTRKETPPQQVCISLEKLMAHVPERDKMKIFLRTLELFEGIGQKSAERWGSFGYIGYLSFLEQFCRGASVFIDGGAGPVKLRLFEIYIRIVDGMERAETLDALMAFMSFMENGKMTHGNELILRVISEDLLRNCRELDEMEKSRTGYVWKFMDNINADPDRLNEIMALKKRILALPRGTDELAAMAQKDGLGPLGLAPDEVLDPKIWGLALHDGELLEILGRLALMAAADIYRARREGIADPETYMEKQGPGDKKAAGQVALGVMLASLAMPRDGMGEPHFLGAFARDDQLARMAPAMLYFQDEWVALAEYGKALMAAYAKMTDKEPPKYKNAGFETRSFLETNPGAELNMRDDAALFEKLLKIRERQGKGFMSTKALMAAVGKESKADGSPKGGMWAARKG